MRNPLVLFTTFVFMFAVHLHAQDAAAKNEIGAIAKRMMNFHAEHSPEIFAELSAGIQKHQKSILEAGKKNRFDVLVATFLARAHQKFDYEIEGDGVLFDNAAAIVNNNAENKVAKFVNDDEELTPSKLDVWWVGFLTTGDEKYLHKILKQTGSPADHPQADPQQKTVMKVANWSFQSNCKRIDAVRKFASAAVEQEEWKSHREFLQTCLAK